MVRLINFRAEDEIETALLASISSGKFNDAQEFLEHLIKNYYAELKFGMAATDIKNEWERPLTLIDDKTEDTLKKIILEVGETNVSALRLYEKNKFYRVGLRKNYYMLTNNNKDNAIVYQRILND